MHGEAEAVADPDDGPPGHDPDRRVEGEGHLAGEARLVGAVGAEGEVEGPRGPAVGADLHEPVHGAAVGDAVGGAAPEPGGRHEGAGLVVGDAQGRAAGGVGAREVEPPQDVGVPLGRGGEVEPGHAHLPRAPAEEEEGGRVGEEGEGAHDEGEGHHGPAELPLALEEEVVQGPDGEHVEGEAEDEQPEGRGGEEALAEVVHQGLEARGVGAGVLLGRGDLHRGAEEGPDEEGVVRRRGAGEEPRVEGRDDHGPETVGAGHEEGPAVHQPRGDGAAEPREARHGDGGLARAGPRSSRRAGEDEGRGHVVVARGEGGKGLREGGGGADPRPRGEGDDEPPSAGGVLEDRVELGGVLEGVGIGVDPEEGVHPLVADPEVRGALGRHGRELGEGRRRGEGGDEGGNAPAAAAEGLLQFLVEASVPEPRGPKGRVPEEPDDRRGGFEVPPRDRHDSPGADGDREGAPVDKGCAVAQQRAAIGAERQAPLAAVEGAGEDGDGEALLRARREEDLGRVDDPLRGDTGNPAGGGHLDAEPEGRLLAARQLDAHGGDAARHGGAVEAEGGGGGDVGPGRGGGPEERGRSGGGEEEGPQRAPSAPVFHGMALSRKRWTRWLSVSATKRKGGSTARS